VAGEVDFLHGGRRDGVQPCGRVGAEIVGTDDRMIDVDEPAAASAGAEFGEKRRLNVGGWLSKS
jgi:hypothetical protein